MYSIIFPKNVDAREGDFKKNMRFTPKNKKTLRALQPGGNNSSVLDANYPTN